MSYQLSDLNIVSYEELKTPAEIIEEYPASQASIKTIVESRNAIKDILDNKDERKIIILGPCSIHNPSEALEYAKKVSNLKDKVGDKFLLIMRTYFEKPRSTTGWKGLISDPYMDETFDMQKGLEEARKLLLDITSMGVPVGTEFLGSITPQYIGDLVSWAAIGARTSESQPHREMASGLSMPVGFKNATSGYVGSAVNSILSAQSKHYFLGINLQGKDCRVATRGNKYCHVILRGSNSSPNYDRESILKTRKKLEDKGLSPNIIVDCSHGNSEKDYELQKSVFQNVISQSFDEIKGLMLESNLLDGKQSISQKKINELQKGVSITDSCLGWEKTEELILEGYKSLKSGY